jgi:subtilisin family serine protease
VRLETLLTVKTLARDPAGASAAPNYLYQLHATFTPNDPRYPLQWHYAQISLPQAWTLNTGTGAIVAVIDSGVFLAHPDLQGRLVGGYDFIRGVPGGNDPGDDPVPPGGSTYHGTHVAGTIAAQATGLKDADGKPMPDVSATVPGYVTKVIGITPPNPTCELGGEVELTAVLDPPDAPAPPCLTWSVYPPNAGVFTVATGAVVTKFRLTNPCASNATITVNCGGTTVTLTLACSSIAGGWLPIQDYADCANWVQDTLVWPNNGEPLRDACGNTLALWCIGGLIPHYELRYNVSA